MSVPDEQTPDGALWVDVHKISHTSRGNGNRGKPLRDRWTLYFTLTNPDGTTRERARVIYGEHLSMFDNCGIAIDWPHNAHYELPQPVAVIFEDNKLIEVGKV